MRKRILGILMCMALIVTLIPGNTVFGNKKFSLESNQTVQSLLSNLGKQGNYLEIQILKDYDEAERFYYLPFLSEGYLIYDSELDVVHEYSITQDNQYIEGKSDLYYTGALGYVQKQQDSFCDLTTGDIIGNLTNFQTFSSQVEDKLIQSKSSFQLSASLISIQKSISGTVDNYEYNPDGICASTAAGMMLRWYDRYVNSKYVPTSLQSASGHLLIEHLRPYIDGSTPGSMVGEVYTGILEYCADQGVSHSGGYDFVSTEYVVGRVDSYGRPFILGLHNHPTYGNHWVTGYGYNINNGTTYVTVNDGWGASGVSINLINCDYIIW